MLKAIISFLFISSVANAASVGFSQGNDLVASPISGRVTVICNGLRGGEIVTYTCRDVAISPAAYDYFVGPKDGRATRVDITATHESGAVRSKTSDYDGLRGKSKEAFNLGISTLFQKPILQVGLNEVRYRIYGGGMTPIAGKFGAVVRRGVSRQCPVARYTSTDVDDCNSPYSVCQHYFEEYNNCL